MLNEFLQPFIPSQPDDENVQKKLSSFLGWSFGWRLWKVVFYTR